MTKEEEKRLEEIMRERSPLDYWILCLRLGWDKKPEWSIERHHDDHAPLMLKAWANGGQLSHVGYSGVTWNMWLLDLDGLEAKARKLMDDALKEAEETVKSLRKAKSSLGDDIKPLEAKIREVPGFEGFSMKGGKDEIPH